MDIVTHAAMGIVLAVPSFESHPMAAACFVLGSTLPDLDVLSRLFGKRAFLRWHQTYTHSLPLIACVGALAWLGFPALGVDDSWAAPALVAGMALHVTLDVTNTYGITLLAPFSKARRSLEWVFFIDAFVLVATAVALAFVVPSLTAGASPATVSTAYAATMASYWIAKAGLRRRAAALAPPSTVTLIPSALIPWQFLGCARSADGVTTFSMNSLTGHRSKQVAHSVFDTDYERLLHELPEFRAMQELSQAYHAVGATEDADGTEIVCRDLRTRNFGGRFGTLTVHVGADGLVRGRHFDV